MYRVRREGYLLAHVVAGFVTVSQDAQETGGRCLRRGREIHTEESRGPDPLSGGTKSS
jgi:hypothetical protein